MLFDVTQYEIAGFNGSPIVACARTLPIGYNKNEDYYFLADSTFKHTGIPNPDSIIFRPTFSNFECEKRLTSLPSHIPMISDAMILYATRQHLEAQGHWHEGKPLTSFQDTALDWIELSTYKNLFVICEAAQTINNLLEKLGRGEQYRKDLLRRYQVRLLQNKD